MICMAIFACTEPILLGLVKCDMKSSDRFNCMSEVSFLKTSFSYGRHQVIIITAFVMNYLQLYNLLGLVVMVVVVEFSLYTKLE